MGKVVDIDFYLIGCWAPHSGILGRDWTSTMDVIVLARYSCPKFRH